MATFIETVVTQGAGDSECECCGVDVDPGCPGCESIPADFTATLSGTGDLAFLDGQTVAVMYIGESGGSPSYFTWSGTAVISGWTVTVGWSIENNTLCNSISGNIQLFKSGECSDITQEMDDPAATTSLDCTYTGTSPETVAFVIDTEQLYNNGEPAEGQCFTGTVGAIALPTP